MGCITAEGRRWRLNSSGASTPAAQAADVPTQSEQQRSRWGEVDKLKTLPQGLWAKHACAYKLETHTHAHVQVCVTLSCQRWRIAFEIEEVEPNTQTDTIQYFVCREELGVARFINVPLCWLCDPKGHQRPLKGPLGVWKDVCFVCAVLCLHTSRCEGVCVCVCQSVAQVQTWSRNSNIMNSSSCLFQHLLIILVLRSGASCLVTNNDRVSLSLVFSR